MKKLGKLATFVAFVVLASGAGAQQAISSGRVSSAEVAKNPSGPCRRAEQWTPATASAACDREITGSPPPVVAREADADAGPADAAIAPVTLVAPGSTPARPVTAAPAPVTAPTAAPVTVVPRNPARAAALPPAAPVAPVVQQAPVQRPPVQAVVAAPVVEPPAVYASPVTISSPTAASSPALVTFQADAFFDFDKVVLKQAGKVSLNELYERTKDIDLEIIIAIGHTDSIGSKEYNLGLSIRRAEAVKAYLVSKGLAKNRVYTEGKGEDQPIADNATRAGRAQNRRVEVEVKGARPA